MTAAEFDTRRRLLGLSIQETADYAGVQRRTVERWISGHSGVDKRAVIALLGLEDKMLTAVEHTVDLAREKNAGAVALMRYRSQGAIDASPHAAGLPLGAHAILIGWTAMALADLKIQAEIVWGDE